MTLDPMIVDEVRSRLIHRGVGPSVPAVAEALREEGRVLDDAGVWQLVEQVRSDLVGFGPLDGWIEAPGVTDVLVNGPSEIWIDRGEGLERIDTRFRDEEAVRRLLQRLVSSVGRRIDDAQPYVDVQLPQRVRLHAVLPPVSDRICLSLRIARRFPFTLEELVRARTVAVDLVPVVSQLIAKRLAFLVCGGTGTGKTTVLATLLGMVDRRSRLVLVEDTAELMPDHPHVVKLEARRPNIEGQGAIAMRELVKQALRMRPDRLVVGEARGGEVVDLLAALNTGHEGGCGTIHANTAHDVPARIEALATAGGLDRDAAHSQLAAAIEAILELDRRRDGTRYLRTVSILERAPNGFVTVSTAWEVSSEGVVSCGPGINRWHELVGRHR